jgi:transcriptional regulator with XRE-family HTH domain
MTRLLRLRYERGVSISAVRLATGVARATISRAEQTGELEAPQAKKLADYYEVPVLDVLGFDREAA